MNVSAIFDDIDFLAHSNSQSYPSGDKLRNINVHYQDVARIIWESAGTWQYDDSNATDFGIATTTLVDSQQDYELPSTLQRVQRVEILDGSGNYLKLSQVDWDDMNQATTEYMGSAGTPIKYDLVGRSIFLYPAPATGYVTLAAGLKVYFDRDVTNLSSVSATPGFATAFHRYLSLGAAIDYTKNEEDRRLLVEQKERIEQGMKSFYAKRNPQAPAAIKPNSKRRWRNYL